MGDNPRFLRGQSSLFIKEIFFWGDSPCFLGKKFMGDNPSCLCKKVVTKRIKNYFDLTGQFAIVTGVILPVDGGYTSMQGVIFCLPPAKLKLLFTLL